MKGSPVRVRASALQNQPAHVGFFVSRHSAEPDLRKPARVGVSSDHPRGEIGVATAVGAAPAFVVEPKQTRAPPRGYVVVALALAGCIAAVGSYKLSLAGEYGPLPHVHAALVAWIVVSYVGCGLVAWTRRPESRFGPLLIAAGLVPALSRLAEADSAALQALGEGLLLLPAVLFLHVFLAYPTGRLVRPFERLVVVSGYAVVLGLDLLRLLFHVKGRDEAVVLQLQRAAVALVALGAVGALISRRRASGRPIRRSLELLVVCFGLALVALVAGTVMLSLGAPGRH
jgi:hypothetical protein